VTERDHPVDDAVRRSADQIEPSDTERRLAEDRLRATIQAEQQEREQPRPLSRRWLWAAAAALAAVAVFLGVQVLRPTPTEAAMEEIARLVEAADPTEVPEQDFLYTDATVTSLVVVPADMLGDPAYEGDFLSYLLPSRRETWYGSDNTLQIRTTNQPPVFFSPDDEAAYYAAGLDDQDRIGQTTTDTVTDDSDFGQWPTNPDELDAAIREQIPPETGRPNEVEYLEIALGLIREVFTPPDLRATTLTLIGRIPGLELVDQTSEQTTFAIEYEQDEDEVETRRTFTLTSRGELVSEQTRILEDHPRLKTPADTPIFTAQYSTPIIVDTLDQP